MPFELQIFVILVMVSLSIFLFVAPAFGVVSGFSSGHGMDLRVGW